MRFTTVRMPSWGVAGLTFLLSLPLLASSITLTTARVSLGERMLAASRAAARQPGPRSAPMDRTGD